MINFVQMIFLVSVFSLILLKLIFYINLGALTLDLNRLYKPAKDADLCTLEIIKDELRNYVSIFEIKRLKGWWPCVDLQSGNPQITVKLILFFK